MIPQLYWEYGTIILVVIESIDTEHTHKHTLCLATYIHILHVHIYLHMYIYSCTHAKCVGFFFKGTKGTTRESRSARAATSS